MKKCLFINLGVAAVLSVVLSFSVGALSPTSLTVEGYHYGASGVLQAVAATSDGGTIAAGWSSDSITGMYDGTVTKVNSSGAEDWHTVLADKTGDIRFYSIVCDPSGGYMAAGYLTGNLTTTSNTVTSKGSRDAVLVKFSDKGTALWAANYGDTGWDEFKAVIPVAGIGYLAVGDTKSAVGFGGTLMSKQDAIALEVDTNGKLIRQTRYTGNGSGNNNNFNSVVATAAGFVAAGQIDSTPTVLAIKPDGTKLWSAALGGSGSNSFMSIASTADGGIIAAGYSSSTSGELSGNKGSADAILLKLDASGNEQWTADVGGQSSDSFYGVTQLANGSYLAVGRTQSSNGDFSGLFAGGVGTCAMSIVNVSALGTVQKVQALFGGAAGETDDLYAVTQGVSGGITAAGDSYAPATDGIFKNITSPDGVGALVYITTTPEAPTNVKATAGEDRFTVSFDPPILTGGSSITGYMVTATSADSGETVTVTGSQSPITVPGLRAGVSYSFTVSAINTQGSGPSSTPAAAALAAASSSSTTTSHSTITAANSSSNPQTGEYGLPEVLIFAGGAASLILLRFRRKN